MCVKLFDTDREMRQLYVYFNNTKAGVLTEHNPGIGYSFKYDAQYISSELPSISATLPKWKDSFESEHLFPFFSNMLPEGANRRVICRSLRIDERDFFGILTAMADKDFIGAVNVRKIDND